MVYMTQPPAEQPDAVDQEFNFIKPAEKAADEKGQAVKPDSRRDSHKSGRPTVLKQDSMVNQRNVMNFNESP